MGKCAPIFDLHCASDAFCFEGGTYLIKMYVHIRRISPWQVVVVIIIGIVIVISVTVIIIIIMNFLK